MVHPKPEELRRPTPSFSFCAVTGSLDRNCVKYTALAAAQDSGQELMATGSASAVTAFPAMIRELLERYKGYNRGTPPEVGSRGVSHPQELGFTTIQRL